MILQGENILFICLAKESYVRNKQIIDILSRHNVVHVIASRFDHYYFRIPIVFIRYLFSPKRNIDTIFLGFLAQPLMLFVQFSRKPIISDLFISLYDTLCYDRKKIRPTSILGKFSFFLDKISCKKSRKIITDTRAHKEFFIRNFYCEEEKIQVMYLGAEANIFYPRKRITSAHMRVFKIFYYGTVIPLQGIEYILYAAKILEDKRDIGFILVGPIKKSFRQLIQKLQLKNITFIPWIRYNDLPNHIAQADICLGGHFGTTEKAKRVIPGKAYQFAAMRKPMILGNTPANCEIFTDTIDCIMVEMGNAHAIAQAIMRLKMDSSFRETIAQRAYETVCRVNNNLINYA